MVEHAGDDLRIAMIASSAIAGVLSVIFVAMRVAARRLPGIPFGADDWWMFASLVSTEAIWRLSLILNSSCSSVRRYRLHGPRSTGLDDM
jgi:hypothetical protein